VGQPTVSRGRAILVGDAAGLADPLMGEGIFNAVLSAQISATVIEKALAFSKGELNDYNCAIAATIIPQMKEAFVFSKVLSRLPVRLFNILYQDDRVWNAFCGMLRGEIDYLKIKQRVSSLSALYNLISHI
jgi:flavin-dependent dehydrogenase